MLKCATVTVGSCRLGMDSTGPKSLELSHVVALKLHNRRYKAQRLGRSAVTGRSTDASRRQMRGSTFEPGTFGVRTRSTKHRTRRLCDHKPGDKPRTVRIAVSEGIWRSDTMIQRDRKIRVTWHLPAIQHRNGARGVPLVACDTSCKQRSTSWQLKSLQRISKFPCYKKPERSSPCPQQLSTSWTRIQSTPSHPIYFRYILILS